MPLGASLDSQAHLAHQPITRGGEATRKGSIIIGFGLLLRYLLAVDVRVDDGDFLAFQNLIFVSR